MNTIKSWLYQGAAAGNLSDTRAQRRKRSNVTNKSHTQGLSGTAQKCHVTQNPRTQILARPGSIRERLGHPIPGLKSLYASTPAWQSPHRSPISLAGSILFRSLWDDYKRKETVIAKWRMTKEYRRCFFSNKISSLSQTCAAYVDICC